MSLADAQGKYWTVEQTTSLLKLLHTYGKSGGSGRLSNGCAGYPFVKIAAEAAASLGGRGSVRVMLGTTSQPAVA